MPYYAVREGANPGIYNTYSAAQAQVDWYDGPKPQPPAMAKFDKLAKALRFVSFLPTTSRYDYCVGSVPSQFYAVPVGRHPGIYDKEYRAREQIAGYSRARWKRFDSWREARRWYDENTVLEVWADGCALSNGLFGARAGVGVYFREDDPRNISEPLSGYQQTNQRAELTAILRALEVIDDPGRHVRITTDSQYAIKCLTVWKDKWLQNGFINSKGLEVVNSDIINEILELMASHRENRGYVELEHVYGHSGNVGNEVADALAKAGALQASAY